MISWVRSLWIFEWISFQPSHLKVLARICRILEYNTSKSCIILTLSCMSGLPCLTPRWLSALITQQASTKPALQMFQPLTILIDPVFLSIGCYIAFYSVCNSADQYVIALDYPHGALPPLPVVCMPCALMRGSSAVNKWTNVRKGSSFRWIH